MAHNHTHHDDIDHNLYPALFEVFSIILMGYLAGYFKLMSSTQSQGLNKFISSFALPALIFSNLYNVQFESVNWYFIASIFVTKTILFVCVILVCSIVVKPLNLGLAAVFAIFITQSNDFALGYPIIKSVYSQSHPDYLKYVYLIAPISLCILNPFGFLLLEINEKTKKSRISNGNNSSKNYVSICLTTIWSVISNPIVFMTVVGLLVNLLFKRSIPNLVQPLLLTLSNSFSAIAIFYLGFMMVNRIRNLSLFSIIAIVVLIITKSLVFPLLAREVTFHLNRYNATASPSTTSSFSTFSFLYGTFPTAPSIYFYLNKYTQVGEDILSPALVFGTLVSAPLMIISAKIISLQFNTTANESESDVIAEKIEHFQIITSKVTFVFSVLSLVCLIWILYLFLTKTKHKLKSHSLLILLVCMQFVLCSIEVAWSSLPSEWYKYSLLTYGYFLINLCLSMSSRLILISITLNVLILNRLIHYNSLKWFNYMFICLLPLILSILITILDTQISGKMSLKFNKSQLIISSLLLLSILLIISYLFIKYISELNRNLIVDSKSESLNDESLKVGSSDCLQPLIQSQLLLNNKTNEKEEVDDEEIHDLNNNKLDIKRVVSEDVNQSLQQLALVILLSIGCLISLFFYLWDIFDESETEIFYELQILNTSFIYGQGFFTFLAFGFESDAYLVPFLFRIKQIYLTRRSKSKSQL